MTHANLVASEITQAGFQATQLNNSVRVSLKSRKVNQMEVETALEQVFGEIQFYYQSVIKGILVTW